MDYTFSARPLGLSGLVEGKVLDPFRSAVPFWGQATQTSSSVSPKRNYGPKKVAVGAINPFRTAVPFWGQGTRILRDLSPKRDCSPKMGIISLAGNHQQIRTHGDFCFSFSLFNHLLFEPETRISATLF